VGLAAVQGMDQVRSIALQEDRFGVVQHGGISVAKAPLAAINLARHRAGRSSRPEPPPQTPPDAENRDEPPAGAEGPVPEAEPAPAVAADPGTATSRPSHDGAETIARASSAQQNMRLGK
jgi:hypothetical protein